MPKKLHIRLPSVFEVAGLKPPSDETTALSFLHGPSIVLVPLLQGGERNIGKHDILRARIESFPRPAGYNHWRALIAKTSLIDQLIEGNNDCHIEQIIFPGSMEDDALEEHGDGTEMLIRAIAREARYGRWFSVRLPITELVDLERTYVATIVPAEKEPK